MIRTRSIYDSRPCARYTLEMIEEIFGPMEKLKLHSISDLLKINPEKFDRGWADMFWVGLRHTDIKDELVAWRNKKGFSEWHWFFDGATDEQFKEALELMA